MAQAAALPLPPIVARYLDAYNRGDVDAIMACFAEDATYQFEINTFCKDLCAGKAAIRRQIERDAFVQTRLVLLDATPATATATATATGAGTADALTLRVAVTGQQIAPLAAMGVQRVIYLITLGYRDDAIASVRGVLDHADEQTATAARIVAARDGAGSAAAQG